MSLADLIHNDFATPNALTIKESFKNASSELHVGGNLKLTQADKVTNISFNNGLRLLLKDQKGGTIDINIRQFKMLLHYDLGRWTVERNGKKASETPYAFVFSSRDLSRAIYAFGTRFHCSPLCWNESRLSVTRDKDIYTSYAQHGFYYRKNGFIFNSFLSAQICTALSNFRKRVNLVYNKGNFNAGLEL